MDNLWNHAAMNSAFVLNMDLIVESQVIHRTQHAFAVGIGKADFCVFLQDFIGGYFVKTFFRQYALQKAFE